MMRSILVALDGSVHGDAAAALALEWAKRVGARVLGLGVLDEASIRGAELVPLGAGAYKQARDEARVADAHRRVVGMLASFRERSAAAGVAAEVLEEVGASGERIVGEAQRCDVIILGHETRVHAETQDRPDAILARVLRGSPRPVVVVPREVARGQGVVVAYDGSLEAARAIQTFRLLGLDAGETVEVVTVHRDGAAAEAIAGRAGDFLAAHGTPHRLHAVGSDTAPARVLLEEVKRRSPRLLVMGSHGHHPLRDLLVTPVARAVLDGSPVPVFVGA
jgi:nucleotide-binding universal stress UspA family protein